MDLYQEFPSYETALENTSLLYKKAKTCIHVVSKKALDELLTNGFEIEQIWEMIQLLNAPSAKYLERNIADFISSGDVELEFDHDDSMETLINDDDDSASENDNDINDDNDISMEEEIEDDASETDEKVNPMQSLDKARTEKTEIDDNFFSVREMDAFADMAEEYDTKRASGELDENDGLKMQFDLGMSFGDNQDEEENANGTIYHSTNDRHSLRGLFRFQGSTVYATGRIQFKKEKGSRRL
jgi:U3 small nucleolar RNA-associated protein MPP10